jgi:hypothetical protein
MGLLNRNESEPAPSTPAPTAGVAKRDRAVAAGAPVGWDYRTVVMGHGFMGWHKDEIDRKDLETQLDQLGREGWELVHVYFDQKLNKEKDGHLMIFKRPVFDASMVRTQGDGAPA